MERLCLDCGTPVKGRADKKYCDDLCRNNYNNNLKAADSNIVKKVNHILKQNRIILIKLNPEGKTKKISRKILLDNGFNLDYLTSVYQTQTGKTYTFCYEYGLLVLTENEFLLVKREEK
ncbi:hypothetical protein ACFOWA_16095 [Pedobacter lithocola]|uniref:DUF2116 family Zn-ribbon domain-containing protein n=1 Tax=Pedobacter lithocola TaxID=1908239 RepID=A0ABV8PFB7_9SPHI